MTIHCLIVTPHCSRFAACVLETLSLSECRVAVSPSVRVPGPAPVLDMTECSDHNGRITRRTNKEVWLSGDSSLYTLCYYNGELHPVVTWWHLNPCSVFMLGYQPPSMQLRASFDLPFLISCNPALLGPAETALKMKLNPPEHSFRLPPHWCMGGILADTRIVDGSDAGISQGQWRRMVGGSVAAVPVSLSEVPVMKHYANCREWSGHWATGPGLSVSIVLRTETQNSVTVLAAVWILDSAADLAPTSFYVQ